MKLADETLLNWKAYSVPATPARPALMPKASIFVRGTFTPAAAAARSLARTDRNRRPVPERRMLATNQHAADQHDEAEDHEGRVVGEAAVTGGADVEAEERRLLHLGGGAGPQAGELVVLEVERLQGDGGGDGDHRQLHATDAQRGYGQDHADGDRHRDAQDHGDDPVEAPAR